MKKITNFLIFFFIACSAIAQIPTYFNTNVIAGQNSIPLSSSTILTWRKGQFFIPPGTLGAVPPANNITAIYFQAGSAATITYPTLNVSLKAGTGTGMTAASGGLFETGMTTVFQATNFQMTTVSGNWYQIILQTPFLYNPTLPLIVEIEHNHPNAAGPTICQAVSIAGPGNGRSWGDYAATNNSGVGTQQLNFGIDVLPATPCTGTPPPNSVVVPTAAICPNATAQLSLSTQYTLSNITYSWMASTTSSLGPWTIAMPSYTNPFISSPTLTTNTWFQLQAWCNGFGSTVTATAGQVTVSPVITGNIPYYEDFEGIATNNQLPNCSWTKNNAQCQTYTSPNINNRVPRSGQKFASFYYTPTGTNYFYTNGLQMYAGITYSASMWFTTEYQGYPTWDLSLMVGPNQSPTGLTTIANLPIAASPNYKQLSGLFTVPTSGLYYVAIRGISSGSSAQYLSWDDLSITIPCNLNTPVVAVNAASTVVCSGQSVNLTATGANTYTWNTGVTTSTLSEPALYNVQYTVIGTNTLTNCSATIVKNIVVNPTPFVSVVASSTAVCEGSSVSMVAVGATSFTWSGSGANGSGISVSPTQNTTYTVVGANSSNNCTGMATMAIVVNTLPSINAIASTAVSCKGEPVILTGSGGTTYTWTSLGSYLQGNPVTVNPLINTTYSVTGTDVNGCSKRTTLVQNVSACTAINEQSSSLSGLNVYPNPNNGEFVVAQANGLSKTVQVIDVVGKVLSLQTTTDDKMNLNIKAYANGVYYIKVTSNDGVDVIKIVKQ